MQTRGHNRLVIKQDYNEDARHYIEKLMDDRYYSRAQPYIEQLMDSQNYSNAQARDGQSNELNSSDGGTEIPNDGDSGNTEAKKVRGPTLLKDIWKLPSGKTIDIPISDRNQAIEKEGRKLASFLGIIVRTPELMPLHIDDWRNFDNKEKKKLVDFTRRRTLANRNNRAKQTMPHTGGSKSIATLMNEQAVNGIEPTRAEIFLLPHKKYMDGRPLDDDSVKTIEMINEKMSNSEGSTEQPPRCVAWEGDVYSQVLGNEKSGYVRGLGLGPTPSILWGSRSFLGNIAEDDSSNEVIQRRELQSELLQMRQLMRKYASNAYVTQSSNGALDEHIPDGNSGHERVPQTSRMPVLLKMLNLLMVIQSNVR